MCLMCSLMSFSDAVGGIQPHVTTAWYFQYAIVHAITILQAAYLIQEKKCVNQKNYQINPSLINLLLWCIAHHILIIPY